MASEAAGSIPFWTITPFGTLLRQSRLYRASRLSRALRSLDAASPTGGASLPISDSPADIITTGWSVLRELLRSTGLVIRPTSADTSRSSPDASGSVACPRWRRAPRPALGNSSDHRVAAAQ